MPYKSLAQAAYFNIHRKELEREGVDVDEWNDSTRGKKLPKKLKKKAGLLDVELLLKQASADFKPDYTPDQLKEKKDSSLKRTRDLATAEVSGIALNIASGVPVIAANNSGRASYGPANDIRVKKLVALARKKGYIHGDVARGETSQVYRKNKGPKFLKKLIPKKEYREVYRDIIKTHKNLYKKEFPDIDLKIKDKGILGLTKTPLDSTAAHEVGHILQKPSSSAGLFRNLMLPASLLGGAAAAINADPAADTAANTTASVATAASLPTIFNELDASTKGYNLMRRLGGSRLRSLGSFKGVPSYLSIAAIPSIGLAIRKIRQKKLLKDRQTASEPKTAAVNPDFKPDYTPDQLKDSESLQKVIEAYRAKQYNR